MRESRSCNYDPELYQRVKESVSMQQVAEYYGMSVDRKGLCLCPFHHDTHPSLRIYPNGKGFYCFTCGAGGDQVTFAARYLGVGNYAAAAALADAFGLPVHAPATYREKREAELKKRRRREKAVFLAEAKRILTGYRGLLCEAIRERNEHFFEGLEMRTYVEYLLDCLEQCPDDLYADKKAVKRIGEIERRIVGWAGETETDGTVPR